MVITVHEINKANCRTYLLCCRGEAALVDPVREGIDGALRELAARDVRLTMVLETHTHADHLMFSRAAKARLGVPFLMHRASPSPLIDHHLSEGDILTLGGAPIRVLHTPGHTPDSVCFVLGDPADAVLSGDTLLIGGSGRTDFPGGDAGDQFDSVTQKLFALPEGTVVWPGHDYKGRISSTIGAEKAGNPRFVGKSRDQYIATMAALGLPFPDKVQQALQVNQSGFEAEEVGFPSVADVASVPAMTALDLSTRLARETTPVVLDVREPEEFTGELGHVEGALLVPLDALEHRLPKLAGYVDRDLVVVCRAGARSASAGAMLRRAGFARVHNLDGGMLAWVGAGLPVSR